LNETRSAESEGEEIRVEQSKTNNSYFNGIRSIINQIPGKIKTLISDGERAFLSYQALQLYDNNNIEIKSVRRITIDEGTPTHHTEANHDSMGILDRCVRTIRDLCYNMRIENITPSALLKVVDIYNNTTHKALTIEDYNKAVRYCFTPSEVENNENLENELIRKMTGENHAIRDLKGFLLPLGTLCYVKNEKGTGTAKRRSQVKRGVYKIIGFNGWIYELINEVGTKIIMSRSKITPIKI
jgi:hypothetical protein